MHGEQQGDVWLPSAYGCVWAGESCLAAGSRLLDEVFGISGVELLEVAKFSEPATSGWGNTAVTLFLSAKTSAIPRLGEHGGLEGIFVDREEFRAITRDYPHMLTPPWNQAIPYFFLPDLHRHT